MSLGQTRSSVMAIMAESSEGTAVMPSAATDYVTLQPDFSFSPAFDSLTNEELRSSLGQAKPIQGIERPEGSFSHYLKHSGTEGAAPEIHELLKSVFGSSSANATERSTTTSSTTTVVKLGAGGSDFARGKAVLIKDSANGYSIRPVHSVSTNDLTLGFAVANAPGSGVAVGKCVNYSPANSGHQSMSLHLYRGNGHLYEIIAGAKCGEFSFTANAGEFINASFSLSGTKYFFNPINIGASDIYIDWTEDSNTKAASIPAKLYRDPHELATALQAAMTAASAGTVTVAFSDSTGKFTITFAGVTTVTLDWNTGANTANTIGDKIGFVVSADDTGALAYTSDNAQDYAAPHTPSYDSADPLVAKNNEVLLGDGTETASFDAQSISFSVSNEKTEVPSVASESGIKSNMFTRRQVTISISGIIEKHDADKFKRFRENKETRFCYNFGEKSGGNWVAGKCGSLYIPTATLSSFTPTDLDSVIGVELELTAFVDSNGNGEVYLNFL